MSSPFEQTVRRIEKQLRKRSPSSGSGQGEVAALRQADTDRNGWSVVAASIVDTACGDLEISDFDRNTLYALTSLFARYPYFPDTKLNDAGQDTGRRRLGRPSVLASLAKDIYNRASSEQVSPGSLFDSFEIPVVNLIAAHPNDLFRELEHLLFRMRSKQQVGIDWKRLAFDMKYWRNQDQSVQKRWTRDWYSSQPFAAEEAESFAEEGESITQGEHQ